MDVIFHNRAIKDLRWIEIGSGLLMMAWAVVNLLSPEHLSQKNFSPLLRVGSEEFWEYCFLFTGALQLLAILYNGLPQRSVAAFLASGLVGCVAMNLLLTGHWPPGSVAYYIFGSYVNILAGAKDGYTWWVTT